MLRKLRTFLLAHGFCGKPGNPPWLSWLKGELEKEGHTVFEPAFPTPTSPRLSEWVETIEQTLGSNFHNVIFIGYSLGGVTILRALETHRIKDKKHPDRARAVFLIGVPLFRENRPPEISEFLEKPYDWKKLRQRAQIFFHIYSKDDPLVDFKEGLTMRRFLGGKFVPMAHMNHFNRQSKFPKLKYLLEQNF